MATKKNNTKEKMSSVQVLRKFFGTIPAKEFRELEKDQRLELAQLAAIELGVDLVVNGQ